MSDENARNYMTGIPVTPEMIRAGLLAFICDCGAAVHREEVVRIYQAMRRLEPRLPDIDGEWAE